MKFSGEEIWWKGKLLVSLHSQTTKATFLRARSEVSRKSDHRHIGEAKFKRRKIEE